MKNILITGASGNLGKSILAAFENESEFHINITSREEIQGSSHLKAYYVDLVDEASSSSMVQELLEKGQHLDAVIFLTGAYTHGDITESTSSNLHKMISANFATAHNISGPLIKFSRHIEKPLYLIFIGAKSAMDPITSVESVAYALSKRLLYNYCEIINESENKYNTVAHIILPGTLDTEFNRAAMPEVDFKKWTNPNDIALCIKKILMGDISDKVILM